MTILHEGWRTAALASSALVCLSTAAPASGQERMQRFDIEAQPAADALNDWARQAGRQIMFPYKEVEGRQTPRVHGTLTARQALSRLIDPLGLTVVTDTGGTVSLARDPRTDRPRAEAADSEIRQLGPDPTETDGTDIVVTGSRIRGATTASPVIRITQDDMRTAGQTSLPEVLRDIPQNFGGGQNPGIGLGVVGSANISGASTINLRGLGPDASLVLLNGHRLAYTAQRQSVDISSIPFLAIERLEIVPDGSSALYGSDAVAGVANVVLKRGFDGVMTSATIGASTDGGNVQQQYGAIAGSKWSGGNLFAAYEFAHGSPIRAADRTYSRTRAPGLWLFPRLEHHNLAASGEQALTSALTMRFDAIYNHRTSDLLYALDNRGDPFANGGEVFSKSSAFAVAPSLDLEIGGEWRTTLAGMYGEDRTDYDSLSYVGGASVSPFHLCHCNTGGSAELSAEGPLFAIGERSARVALGGGFRAIGFRDTSINQRSSRDTYYAFGELLLPLASPGRGRGIIYRLDISAAGRYEYYPDLGGVFTPKIGIIYSPSASIDLRASWGRSFKAPTLVQQYSGATVTVQRAATRGGVGLPANATVLQYTGGNPDLAPERATTWSMTANFRPSFVRGLDFEITYFNVDYRDRIVSPITFIAQALSNPIYKDLVNAAPTEADKAAGIALGRFLNNLGRPYNPAEVIAIIDNRNRNVAAQAIEGVDANLRYRVPLGSRRSIHLTANWSYLDSKQRLSSLQPEVPLSGNVFNPPHWRGRAGLTYASGGLSFTVVGDYIGGLDDIRLLPTRRIRSMTTADIAARYITGEQRGFLSNLDLLVSVDNVLNERPPLLGGRQVYEQPYDPTNFSPAGRVVRLSVTKKW